MYNTRWNVIRRYIFHSRGNTGGGGDVTGRHFKICFVEQRARGEKVARYKRKDRQREREKKGRENEEETKVLLLRGNMYRFGLGRIRLTS